MARASALSLVQPGLRVVIVTGHAADATERLSRGPHHDLVLHKPVGIADLVRVIDEMARGTARRHG